MTSSDDEFSAHQVHLGKDFLVIQPRIGHRARVCMRKQRPSDPDGAIDLAILAHKVSRHVGEPVCIRHDRLWQIDDGSHHRRMPRCQSLLSLRSWWRALHHCGSALQLLRVRRLEVDQVQCHDQARRCMCCHGVLSDPAQPFQQITMVELLVPYEPIQPLRHRPNGFLRSLHSPSHSGGQGRLPADHPLHYQFGCLPRIE
jgi:hypothetical protein